MVDSSIERGKVTSLSNYTVFETQHFQDEFSKFSFSQREKLLEKIRSFVYTQLKNNPYYGSNIKKLKDKLPETWRYRIGDYRLTYEIDKENKTIVIYSFRHRKEAYDQ